MEISLFPPVVVVREHVKRLFSLFLSTPSEASRPAPFASGLPGSCSRSGSRPRNSPPISPTPPLSQRLSVPKATLASIPQRKRQRHRRLEPVGRSISHQIENKTDTLPPFENHHLPFILVQSFLFLFILLLLLLQLVVYVLISNAAAAATAATSVAATAEIAIKAPFAPNSPSPKTKANKTK